jgi:hypothetical protein
MKTKINFILIAAVALTLSFSACNSQSNKSVTTEQTKEQKTYQCPMKCEGEKTYDKPGTCPVCGMDLAEIKPENIKK